MERPGEQRFAAGIARADWRNGATAALRFRHDAGADGAWTLDGMVVAVGRSLLLARCFFGTVHKPDTSFLDPGRSRAIPMVAGPSPGVWPSGSAATGESAYFSALAVALHALRLPADFATRGAASLQALARAVAARHAQWLAADCSVSSATWPGSPSLWSLT